MSNVGSALLDAASAAYTAMAQFYAEDWYIAQAANEGYFVCTGCAVSASGTAGKVDLSAGTVFMATTELNVAAVTAASTTITSLADGTNPKWVGVEIDSTGTIQFNAGTAAANPQKPTPTSARVVVAWLYVPASATTVDASLSSANGAAKIMEARQLKPGPSPSGWQYDQNTWVYGSATTFTVASTDVTGYLKPGTKVSWNDGTNVPGYGVIASATFSTNTTVTLITNSDYSIANATIIRPRFSNQATPVGFPAMFNVTLAYTGATITAADSWTTWGRWILIDFRHSAGTATATTLTAVAPVASSATFASKLYEGHSNVLDNSASVSGPGLIRVSPNSTTITFYPTYLAGAWAASSGTRRVVTGQVIFAF